MKKFTSFALAALMVTALGMSANAATFEAATGTAVVDGKKDNIYVGTAMQINIEESTKATSTKGATGVGYAAWDENNLYVFIEVTDAAISPKEKVTSIWSNDSCEIYINLSGKTDGSAITGINAAQYTVGPNYTQWAGGGKHRETNMKNAKYVTVMTDKGYNLEVSIPWGADYKAAADATFPFGLGINDDADGDVATRENHPFTNAGLTDAYSKATANWDTLKLSTKKYEAPKPAAPAANTADLGSVAALVSLAAAGAFISLKKRK